MQWLFLVLFSRKRRNEKGVFKKILAVNRPLGKESWEYSSRDHYRDSIIVGKSVLVGRTITPTNATNKSVTWTSSNTAVALVNNDATITASINGFSSQAVVTVTTIPSSYSTRLSGLAKSLSVMTGDIITAEVYAKYIDTNSNNWNAVLTNLMATILNGTAPVGTFVDVAQQEA